MNNTPTEAPRATIELLHKSNPQLADALSALMTKHSALVVTESPRRADDYEAAESAFINLLLTSLNRLASDALCDEIANAFLRWPLPPSVCADYCATIHGDAHRVGTNLLSFTEAQAMAREVVFPLINGTATRATA